MATAFPYLLVRLPAVPRSRLHLLDGQTVPLLQSPPFFQALSEANPELARRVAALRSSEPAAMRKKERQTVRAALRYLWRAALRPVPCGRMCSTALGLVASGPAPAPGLTHREVIDTFPASRVAAIARSLWSHPEVEPRSRLYLSPLCWTHSDGAIWHWPRHLENPEPVAAEFLDLVAILQARPGARWCDLEIAAAAPLLRRAIAAGIVEQFAGLPGDDEHMALLTLLWEAVPRDLTLLDAVAALTPESAAATHRDTCVSDILPVPLPGVEPFFQEMAHFGSLLAESAAPEARGNAELFRLLSPTARPMPLLEFYHAARGLAPAIRCEDDTAGEAARFAARFSNAGSVPFEPPDRWTHARIEDGRICFRFRRAADGPDGARYHVAFFGSGRMSLLPRYERLPFAGVDLPGAVRSWMQRWPDVCEIYGGFPHDADFHSPATARTIQFMESPPQPGSLRFGDLWVAPRAADGVPVLTDASGRRIRPVYFGVSAEGSLHPLMTFALALGNPEMSLLEATCRMLNHLLTKSLETLPDGIRVIPEITLGRTIVLSPKLWLIPRSAFPDIAAPVTAGGFDTFHTWLCREGLPAALAQAARPGEEPQWLDFRHPEGVNNFLRILRSADVVLVAGPFLLRDEDGLAAAEGWYEPEYYAELAVPPAVAAPSATHIPEEASCAS